MSVAKCFTLVKESLDAYLQSHGGQPISHELGADHIADADTFPRIVWALTGGPIRPPKRGGPQQQRAIRRRYTCVDVHIWGPKSDVDVERFEACEALMGHFNAAARVGLTGYSWRAVEEDWTIGQQQKSSGGQLVVLKVEINLPLTFEPLTVVTGVKPGVSTAYPNQ